MERESHVWVGVVLRRCHPCVDSRAHEKAKQPMPVGGCTLTLKTVKVQFDRGEGPLQLPVVLVQG